MPSPPSTTPRVVGGRKVLLICAALVICLAGVAGWWMVTERPRPGAYIDALALDGDFVVALREETTSKRAFVELYGEGEGLRWQALVPRYAVPDGAIGVAASERAVTVRFPRDGRTQVFGFSAVSAKKLGTVVLGEDLARQDDGHVAPGVATLAGGALAFELLQPDGGPTRVYAVSLTMGAVAWTTELPTEGVESTWVGPDHLVVEQPGVVAILARDDGAARTVEADAACVAPGLAGDVLVTGRGSELVVEPVDGGEARRVALAPGVAFTGLCGARAGRVHALVRDGAGDDLMLATLPLAGAAPVYPDGRPPVVARGAPGAPYAAQRVAAAARAPFAGALRRVVPVRVERGDQVAIVGIDVDQGAPAYDVAVPADLGALVDASIAVLARAGDRLVSIDPSTGATRAVRAPDTLPLRAHHVAGGTVWLVGPRGLLALDAATLARRGAWRVPPAVESTSL